MLDDLLRDVAAPAPAPGAGSSAACSCALAAALVEMTATIELRRGTPLPSVIPARLKELRGRALQLAEVELSSYEPVLAASRLPNEDPAREERVATALVAASEAPLEVAEAAAEVAALGTRVAAVAAPAIRGDAAAGTLLAEAAAAAAAGLVEANLQGGPEAGAPLLERARAASERAASARAEAQATRRPISDGS